MADSSKRPRLPFPEIGARFGRRVVIQHELPAKGHIRVIVRCDCGTTGPVEVRYLNKGNGTRCQSCWAREMGPIGWRSHKPNPNRDSDRPEYYIWSSMWQRCTNPKDKAYQYYGARNIAVCERWRSFRAFLQDMGERPSDGHSIDRIDNDEGYWCGNPQCLKCGPAKREPNCRWATRSEQAQNTRQNTFLTFQGRTMTLGAWALKIGLKQETLSYRIRAGWSVKAALTTPTLKPGQLSGQRRANIRLAFNGKVLSLSEWARKTGINRHTLEARIWKGWSVEAALTTPVRPHREMGIKNSRQFAEAQGLLGFEEPG